MLLLVTIAQPQMEKHAHPHLGRLVQPRHYWRIEDTAAAGIPWAADNDAFGGFGTKEAVEFVKMADRLAGLPGCLFVATPDVVGDAAATAELFREWAPRLRERGLPVGYVAQDGLSGIAEAALPWDELDALFIGGTTPFKLGPIAEALVTEAKRRRKHVHMGRVNTPGRVRYANTIGCDSVDGSQFARWRDIWLPQGLGWVAAPQQMRLGD